MILPEKVLEKNRFIKTENQNGKQLFYFNIKNYEEYIFNYENYNTNTILSLINL